LLKSIEWYIIPCQVSYELGSKQLIPISRYPNIFLEEHDSFQPSLFHGAKATERSPMDVGED